MDPKEFFKRLNDITNAFDTSSDKESMQFCIADLYELLDDAEEE